MTEAEGRGERGSARATSMYLRRSDGLEDCHPFATLVEPWELEPLSEEEAAAYEARSERMRKIGKVVLAISMSTMMITWVTKYFFMTLL